VEGDKTDVGVSVLVSCSGVSFGSIALDGALRFASFLALDFFFPILRG